MGRVQYGPIRRGQWQPPTYLWMYAEVLTTRETDTVETIFFLELLIRLGTLLAVVHQTL